MNYCHIFFVILELKTAKATSDLRVTPIKGKIYLKHNVTIKYVFVRVKGFIAITIKFRKSAILNV